MKYAKISFPTREVAVRAYYELSQRGRVVSLPDCQFIVPEPGVAFLKAEGITHQVHEWMHEDHVNQTLRNTPAHSV
jgi:hypothetical protein